MGCGGAFNPNRALGHGTSLSQMVHGGWFKVFCAKDGHGHCHPEKLSTNVISSILCGVDISMGFNPGLAEASE